MWLNSSVKKLCIFKKPIELTRPIFSHDAQNQFLVLIVER
jgi:hypothetical protein